MWSFVRCSSLRSPQSAERQAHSVIRPKILCFALCSMHHAVLSNGPRTNDYGLVIGGLTIVEKTLTVLDEQSRGSGHWTWPCNHLVKMITWQDRR